MRSAALFLLLASTPLAFAKAPLELKRPAAPTLPPKAATGTNVPFAGGGGAWMRFRQGDHACVACSGIGRWGPRGETATKAGIVSNSPTDSGARHDGPYCAATTRISIL